MANRVNSKNVDVVNISAIVLSECQKGMREADSLKEFFRLYIEFELRLRIVR